MSCCTIKKEPKGPIKEVELLKKHFDEVLLEKKEEYQLLTLRDISPKQEYDYVVYLQVKIPYVDHNTHNGHTDAEYVKGVAEKILDYIDLLKEECNPPKLKTVSLFGDEEEEEEPLPHTPQEGNDISWEKYYKEEKRIKKNRLMKKYSFFELCNFGSSWCVYRDKWLVDSWIAQLPRNDKEMIELVKEAIVKATTSKDGYGRFEDYWWDDEYNYICRDGALSDIELIERAKQLIRLYLVPYHEYRYVSVDLSYTGRELGGETDYRFWFDGRKINGCSWIKCDIEYELNDEEFISWLREHFNVAQKEAIGDEEILKENVESVLKRSYRYENPDFDVFEEINKADSFKEFKAAALKAERNTNSGGSGYAIDGYSTSIHLDASLKRSCLTIAQSRTVRKSLGRETDSLEAYSYGSRDMVVIYDLNFVEVLEYAYKMFKKETKPRQTTLFDFLAA